MNSISIDGRLGKDPEIKHLNSGKAVCNFTIANQRNKETTDWFDCVAWDKTAEFIAQYFHKGKGINVEGSLQQERWQNDDGQNRSKVVINVFRAGFPLGERDGGNQGNGGQQRPAQQKQMRSSGTGYSGGSNAGFPPADYNLDIDDIPF